MTSAEAQPTPSPSPMSPISRLAELGERLQRTADNLTDMFQQESVQAWLTSAELDVLRTAADYARMAGGEIIVVGIAARDETVKLTADLDLQGRRQDDDGTYRRAGSGRRVAGVVTDEQLVAMPVDRARGDGLQLTGEGTVALSHRQDR
jgi:hypothetical protein